jgi:hypothetical protein
MTGRLTMLIPLTVAACLVATVAVAADPATQCQAEKKKTAGKYSACRLKTIAVADLRGRVPDFGNCEEKFSKKWTAIELKYGAECPTYGDQAAIKSQLDTCATGVDGDLYVPRRVFITNLLYKPGGTGAGFFNSLASADAICQGLAEGASPPLATNGQPRFKAWLSDTTAWPADGTRFTQPNSPYRLVGDFPVASNWADLVDGTLSNPIEIDQNGNPASGFPPESVWTSTEADGTSAAGPPYSGCSDWTSSAPFPMTAVEGFYSYTNSIWTYATPLACDQSAHFYCFQQ